MRKLLEALSGVDNTQVIQELDEEEKQKESEEIRKLKHRFEWSVFESEK